SACSPRPACRPTKCARPTPAAPAPCSAKPAPAAPARGSGRCYSFNSARRTPHKRDMAVYTEVSEDEARALLQRLGLGELTALRGIEGGIENTNYFASTTEGEWVLTLFERLTHAQLPFYLHLMKHLAQHGVPVPDPQAKPAGLPVPPGEDDLLH